MRELTFGKYRGKSLRWIVENDPDYAVWAIREARALTPEARAELEDLLRKSPFPWPV